MGIESDQLVFDYLSRVGDLAHRTSMTAAERARLVSGLRGRIDRLRAEEGGAESKAAVRKILTRLGKPEEVVSTAAGGGGISGADTSTASAASIVPTPRSESGGDRSGEDKVSLWKRATPKRAADPPPARPAATASSGASAPHLAGMDELGPEESDPDWWRVDAGPFGEGGGSRTFGEPVPGFVGGIELPELFEPPKDETKPGEGKPETPGSAKIPVPRSGAAQPPAAEGVEAVDKTGAVRRLWPAGVRLGPKAGAAVGPRVGGVVEWAAALLLVAGALIGSLIPLAVGWLAAWWSPRLSRNEAKWAAAGMPALVASGAVVWLWGRVEGRWGDPIAQGGEGLQDALTGAGPVLLRAAAVASALFLVWRARRPKA